MPTINIKDRDGQVVAAFRPRQKVTIDGYPFPRSHPWEMAAGRGVLDHPELDKAGFMSELIPDPPFKPQRENVTTERDRRISQQVTVTLDDARTFPVDMANGGRANIADIAQVAGEKEAQGIGTPITFRDANNTDQVMTNTQFRALAMQVASVVNAIYKASWVLKDTDPIPIDYTDDKHWP